MIVALAFGQVRSSAALVYLNGRAEGLNSPLSFQKWTPGISGDTLVWAGPLPAGAATINVHSRGGGAINLEGIQIASTAEGGLTLQAANVVGPPLSGIQTINLGAGGIDMAEASQNLTINKTNGTGTVALNLTSPQFWNVGPGRTLTVNADTSGSSQLTLATLGASSAITLGGSLNLGAAPLVIDKQGTGAVTLNGAVTAGSVTAVNGVTGNLVFGSTVTAPTVNVNNQSSGALTFTGALNASTSTTINSQSSGALAFSSTVNTGALNVSTNSSGTATYSGVVTANAINLLHQSSGTLTFANSVNATTSLDINVTKNAAVNVNTNNSVAAPITAPTFNLTTQSSGNVTFGTNANIIANTALNINALGSSTYLLGGTVSAGVMNVDTNIGTVLSFSRSVASTVGGIDIDHNSTGGLSFASTVNAATTLDVMATKTSTLAFNGNITAPTFNLTTFGTGATTFGTATSPTAINAATLFDLQVRGTNTTTINSSIGATSRGAVNVNIQSLTGSSTAGVLFGTTGATRVVNATTLNVVQNTVSTLGTSLLFSDNVDATTSLSLTNYRGTGSQGTMKFNGDVTAPTISIVNYGAAALNFGQTTAPKKVNASTGLTISSFAGSTTTFDSTIGETVAGAVTLNSHANSVLNLNRAVSATNLTLLRNSTGAATFASTTNAASLNLTGTRSGATTFTGAVTAPVVSLTTLSTGNVAFSSTLNATTGINFKALAANTITFTGAVTAGTFGTAATPNVTHGTLLLSSTLTAPEVNVISAGAGNATFTGTVNAATSFAYSAFGNNAATINNLTSPLINLTTNSTSGTALTLAGAVNGFTTLNITNGGTGTVTVSNTAAANLTGTGASTVNLTQNSTGTITVGGATGGAIAGASTALNINFTGLSGVGGTVNLNASNTYVGTTTITGGTTNLGYATTNTSKLADAAALTLNRAVLNIAGAASAGHTEIVGSLAIGSGASSITRTASTTGTLQAGQITRSVGGVLNLGEASIVTTNRTNTNAIIGGWATVAGTNWAINSTGAANGAITALAAYTTTNVPSGWVAANNVSLTASPTTTLAPQTINSLKLDTAATTTALTFGQGASTTLTIDSGGILLLGTAAATRTIGTAGANLTAGITGNATAYRAGAANNELFFHVGTTAGTNIVASTIINNSALTPTTVGVVKAQSGTLILTADNTYTGQTTIAGGTLQLGNNGATGSISASSAVVNHGTLAFSRNGAVVFNNSISGVGGVTQTQAQNLTLGGTNTYYGDTLLTLGTLLAGSAAAISPNSSIVFPATGTSTFNLNGFDVTIGGLATASGTNASSTVALGTKNLTVGQKNLTQTYTGLITGSGNLTKVGNGVLTLSGNNTFNGTLTVGSLDRNLGGVTLTGTTAITGATVNGGTLTFQPGATDVIARTIAGNVTANGGTFSFGTNANGVNTISGNLAASNAAVVGFSGATSTGVVTGTTTLSNAAALTVANIGNFTGAVTLNDQSSLNLTSTTATHRFAGGLTVGQAATITALAGNNTFGASVLLANAGTLTAAGFQSFENSLTLDGPLAMTLGDNVTQSQFGGAVTVSKGTLTVNSSGVRSFTVAGSSTTGGSTTVTTGANGTAPLVAGLAVTGTNIPTNATVASVTSGTQYVITGTAPTVTAGSLTHTFTYQLVNVSTNQSSTTVTCANTALLSPGLTVIGTGVMPGTTVAAVTNSTTFELNQPAVATLTGQTMPISGLSILAGSSTNGTTTVTTTSTAGLKVGMPVAGPNIPVGATVASITNGTSFQLSVAATGTATNLGLRVVSPVTFGGLLTVNNAGTFTSDANNNLSGGLLVDGGGTITSMVGNNTFGATPGGSVGATFNNTGTLSLPGVNVFNGPLNVAGNLALTLGNAFNSASFKGEVNVGAGSVTVGGAGINITLGGASTTSGSANITTASTAALLVGMAVSGTNIPTNSYIKSITSSTVYVISANASASGTNLTHTASPSLVSGATTFGLTAVTVGSTALLKPGMVITGPNIAPGSTVASVTSATVFQLSLPAIGTGTALTLGVAQGTTFDKLVTVNGSGTFTANGGNTYTKGLLVESTGVVNNLTGNNIFGAVANGTDGATFRQAGGLTMAGVNLFNGPLLIDGPLGLTLGSAQNSTAFKGPVTLTGGSLTVGGTTTLSCTFTTSSALITTTTNTSTILVGMVVTGAGIPAGATVTAVNSATTFTISATPTAPAAAAIRLTFQGVNTFDKALALNGYSTFTGNGSNVFTEGVTVAPAASFNSSGNSTFGGTGLVFNNAGSLTMAGTNVFTGPLTLNGALALSLTNTVIANTFTGPVTINEGSLSVSHATNTFAGLVTQSSPVSLTFSGTGGTQTFNNGLVVTDGVLTAATSAAVNITAGGLTISGPGGATFGTAGTANLAPVVINGDLNITGSGSSTFNGGVTVSGNTVLGNSRKLTFGGNNTFTGSVLFNNPNSITFTGTTSISGAVTMNRGVVTIPGATNPTAITLNGGSLTIGTKADGTSTIPITISGAGSLLSLTETVTASGSFNLPFGSLLLIAANKEFIFSNSASQTMDGLIGGGGAVTKNGAGALTLAGPMSFQGDFKVNGGSVTLTPSAAFPGLSSILPDRSSIILAGGTSLNLNGFREKVGSVTGNGSVNLGANGSLLLGGNNSSGTLSGGISGSGFNELIKQGSGSLSLYGVANFGGKVKIEGGTLEVANNDGLGNGNAIGDTTNVAISQPGSTFSVTTNETVGSVTGVFGSTVNLGAGATLTTSYTDTSGGSLSAVLTSGSRLVGELGGTGTRDLISSMFAADSSFIYDPSWIVQVIGTGQDDSPGLVLSASILSPGGTGTLNFTRVGLLASNLTGAGNFVKNGPGTLMLVGNNTNTGVTRINAGTFQLGGIEVSGRYVHQNILSDQSRLEFGTTGSQTVNLADNASNLLSFERVGSIGGGAGSSSVINLINGANDNEKSIGALVVGSDNTNSLFVGQINGTDALALDQPGRAFFMKEGDGTFTFRSTGGGFDGTTRVEAGTLAFPSGSNGLKGDRGNIVISNATNAVLSTVTQQSVLSLAGGAGTTGTFRNGVPGALLGNRLNQVGGEINITSEVSVVVSSNNGEHAFSGRITGVGGFAKADNHTAILMGANTYTGDTQINGGILQLGYLSRSAGVGAVRASDYVGSLSSSTLVSMTSGSLVLNSLNVGVRSLISTSQGSRIVLGNGTFTLNAADGEDYAGTIRTNGVGVATGFGLPHIGVVEVKSGTLNLMSRSSGDLLSTNLAGIDGPRLVIGNGGTVRLGNTAANNGGNLADTTRVTIAAGGTLSFRNENTSGEVIGSLSGAGTVDLGSGGRTLALTEAGGLSHGVFTGVITGTGNVLVNGQGSLILSGTNTYSGTTQLSAGASVTLKTGNTAGTSTILPDTTVLRLGQGTVRLQGVATETVASTTLDAGFSKVIRDFASTATLNLGAITVNSGGALQVTPGTVTTTTPNLSSGILGGYALAGSASWAVKNSGTGLIEALDETAYSSFWAVGNHTNIDDDNLDGDIYQTNATTGTLRFGAPPSGEFQDIALIINQTATITNGGILMNRDFGQYNAAINPGITSPKLVSGTNHLYIHQFNELGTLTINASIQENTIPLHFVKTGPGKLVLAGNNLFSGSVTIAGGTLQAGNNSALSGNPLGVTSTPIANDGILALNVGPGPELAIFNLINGSGSIRQIGDGDSALVEPNTYTGRTSVIAGVLSAQNPLALGSVVGLTAVSDGAKLVLSGDGGVTTTFERIALKGGTLDLTNGAVLGGQVITTVPSTINAPGGAVSLKGSVISPQYQAVTLNAVGNNGNISIYEPNYWGSVELGSGSVDLRGGDLGRGDVINNTTEGQGLTIDTGEAFRVLANNISGTGRMTQASGDLYLTGNNTFEGGISIGATSRAILHVGSDSFSGTLGTGPVVIDSPTDNNSQLRFHRADTLLVTNSVTLNPNDNNGPTTPGGTTPRNADFVKEGAGNLVFLGALVAGPHGGANSGPNTQRALVTVNSGRLIFDGATLTNSTDSSLAINNNSHIEFRGSDTNAQTGTLFGAMGGGGTWVMNAGIIKLNNTGTTLGGWNGNVFIRQGELQTLAIDQLGNDLDVIINNGAALTVVADETVGNIFTQKGGVLESVINIRMDDGDEKIMSGFITGGGSLTLQNGTLNLYGTDSNFGGDLILVSGTARVLSLRNNGETSAAGSGDSIVFGEAGSTSSGALEYLGLGNSSSRGIVLAADDAGTAVNSTISSNGTTGALILSGAVTRSAGTKTLTLAGSNLLGNTFSGSLQAGIGLIKSGTGTWRLTGNRPTYANEISAFGGLLEIAGISVLGDMGAGTSRTFNLNNSGAFRFLNPTVETETFNSLKTFNIYGTGGFTNDGSSTLVFNGSILQPMGSTESTAGRNLVLDGSNATNNSINGTITGTVGGQSTNIGIVKNGSGKWIINNSANNLTGGTTINAGTLEINGGNALADVGTVSLTNGAVNGFSYANSRLNVLQNETVGALSGSIGTVVDIAAGQTLSMIANSGTFQGVIQGGGGLTVSSNANDSARVLTLSNINTFSGAVSILGGTQSDRSAANRIDFYYLANGGVDSSLGRSSNAASNLTIDTKGKGGGLRFIGFSNQSTDRLMTIGTGNGSTSGESAASFWADGQTSGKQVPTVSFTNTGAVVFTGSGNRKLSLRGGNRGDAYNDTTEAFVPYSSADYGFNRFSLSIGDGPGGATSIAKLEDSVWLLDGANSYTGAVLVERGTLAVGHNTALGTSAGGVTVSQASNDTISFLDLRGGITVTGETLTINGGANNTGNGWGASLGNNTWTALCKTTVVTAPGVC